MREQYSPVGVFDSGMGGISVLREITKYMPQEDIIYVGDSANAPYGTKDVSVVRDLTIGHIRNLVESHRAKAIAVACNTATSAAVADLRVMYPDLPLVGVEPAIKPAVLAGDHGRILVMATPRTLAEPKFRNLQHQYEDLAEIYPLPCPGLMEYVERGILKGPELEDFLRRLLEPYLDRDLTGIVLGCTHYPFLRDSISGIVGEEVGIFDGGEGTARELNRRLSEAGLKETDPDRRGSLTFYNTSGNTELLELSRFLFTHNNPDASMWTIRFGDRKDL